MGRLDEPVEAVLARVAVETRIMDLRSAMSGVGPGPAHRADVLAELKALDVDVRAFLRAV